MSARDRIHAMLPICDSPTEADKRAVDLDARLDAVVAEARAEVLAADGQAYDGELAMLRGLVRTLRTVVRPDDADMGDVRRLLHHHASDDAAAREADPAPDFFQRGHTYTREHHDETITFVVKHVSTSPDGRTRAAHGWRTRDWDTTWTPSDAADLDGWTDVTGEMAS